MHSPRLLNTGVNKPAEEERGAEGALDLQWLGKTQGGEEEK